MTQISLDQELPPLGRSQILLCAACMGLLVSNMYLFQPLTPFIALEMGWTISQANILIPACQFGVALGLLLIVPRGCTKFCVNGLLMGENPLQRRNYDRRSKTSSTKRINR